ncbi:MAG: DUF4962 domain-containing protein [Lentisphaeria bacterium]|nr:DUF4962 domain-containing protein [Lentisphaeria bacterium]
MQIFARCLIGLLLCACACHAADWRTDAIGRDGAWHPAPKCEIETTPDGTVRFTRRGIGMAALAHSFEVDLSKSPWLRIEIGDGNAQWKLIGALDGGPEKVLGDRQTEGVCVRNLAEAFAATGQHTISLRFSTWGWSGIEKQTLALASLRFSAQGTRHDARTLSGLMAERDWQAEIRSRDLTPTTSEHPRLRFRASQREQLRKRATTTHAETCPDILARLARLASGEPLQPKPMTTERIQGDNHLWRPFLLELQPPEIPAGRSAPYDPFVENDVSIERTWRVLYWHMASKWVIGAAVSADSAFADQARRWALAISRWRFWEKPAYRYFDFGTGYPLQVLSHCYDIAHGQLTEAERVEVRSAIAAMADGLYVNMLSGHGSIYNDLRGNHTAVTCCGLGTAGLALLGEHPRAGRWTALAERFLLDTCNEHTSGAWTESPSYGNYGVNEWLRFADLLRNAAGVDHLRDPFFMRYAKFQLMIADWEGRDLGYNGGGAGALWNHWIFQLIAREFESPEVQWLAQFNANAPGYGDAFWWFDPTRPARPPAETNTGTLFADVGLSVWRSGWSEKPTILLHHCGRKGQHKEENMNQITLYAHGQRILPDGLGGRTTDHNVPIVDGRKQNKWMPGTTLLHHSDERCGYSCGDASRSYGRSYRRHVFFFRPGTLVLVDEIDLGARGGTARFQLHPNGDTQADGAGFRTTAGDASLRCFFVTDTGETLSPTIAKRKNTRRATHDVTAERTGSGPTRTITLLLFGATENVDAAVPKFSAVNGALEIQLGERRLRIGSTPGVVAGHAAATDLWVARFQGDALQTLVVPHLPKDGEPVCEVIHQK